MTISDKEFYIDDENPYDWGDGKGKQTWWEIRPTMVQVPARTWAKIKSYIIKTCKKYGNCDSAISGWERRAGRMDEQLGQKGL
jgi:hypothetical protein